MGEELGQKPGEQDKEFGIYKELKNQSERQDKATQRLESFDVEAEK